MKRPRASDRRTTRSGRPDKAPAEPATASPGQAVWRLGPEETPDIESLVIEDGAPVDGIYSEKQMRLLTEALYSSWDGPEPGREFLVLANVGLFYSDIKPPLVPDVLLSLDVSASGDLTKKENRSYFVWRRGKVPDLVIEIVSNREGGEDTDKFRDYARLNIPYYVIFDPLNLLGGGVLRVFALAKRHYEAVAPEWLEDIGLGLILWKGTYEGEKETWLRWCDKHGRPIATGAELASREKKRTHKAEQARVEAEQAKVEAERAKTKAEEENKHLKAKLRAAGIDPNHNGS